MKEIPAKLMIGLLGLCTAATIAGTVSGTLAWYAYATRASFMFSGTSVFDNGQLQIGLKSEVEMPDLVTAGMEEEQVNGSYYYFAPAGEGLSSDFINLYLDLRGYASHELTPITSGEFKQGVAANYKNDGGIKLRKAPSTEKYCPDYEHDAAQISDYSHLTFAFRAFRTNSATGNTEYVSGKELWLTYAQVRASVSSTGVLSRAMRMYVNRDETTYGAYNGFIFNPSDADGGETKVAGLLNLGRDVYYDFDENGEIVYGEYDILDGVDSGIINGHYSGADELKDINGTNSTNPDTFTAKHSPETPKYYENLNKLDLKTAKYYGIDNIKPNKNGDGVLSNPRDPNTNEEIKTSLCITGGESVGYIGEFDATIYLEGWDFSLTDEEQKHKFDFQLRFEINRIQYL